MSIVAKTEEVSKAIEVLALGEHKTKKLDDLTYISNFDENILTEVQKIISLHLSEPYSIYTYRYFLIKWPNLCIACMEDSKLIGSIICKEEMANNRKEGYIGMLAVDEKHRGKGIGSELVSKAIEKMREMKCDEVVLETEVTNLAAIALYTRFGFIKVQKLFRYYLNGGDAFRLKLYLTDPLSCKRR
uniref:N-acetyltransferase domain-containing protein n=1 Tax=Rhabditophanes sp. KR3021 TaxID=114890 RepID=A0AC35UGX7_9BILA